LAASAADSKRASALGASHVALIGVLVRGADGDDATGAGHLQREIGIVGDDHELGMAWSPQNGVVGPTEPDNLEGEGFPPEIRRSLEANR
jgi:hypothetical protein